MRPHWAMFASGFGALVGIADMAAAMVAVIWLGVLGHFWWAIGCIIFALVAPVPLGYVMIPGTMLAALPVGAEKRRASPARIVLLASPCQLYTAVVVTLWCMWVMTLLVIQRANSNMLVPLMLLAFAVATYPFDYMASHDSGSGSFVLVLFTKVAVATAMAYFGLALPDSAMPVWFLFAGIMLAGVGVATAMAYLRVRDATTPGTPNREPKIGFKRIAGLFQRKPPLPPEVEQTLRELAAIEPELRASIGVNSVFLPEDLFVAARQMIQNAEATVHTVNVEKVPPQPLAWLILSNAAGNGLATGRFHIYRGVLSGQGQALLSVYARAINELEKAGYYQGRDRTAEDDRRWIRDHIRDAG